MKPLAAAMLLLVAPACIYAPAPVKRDIPVSQASRSPAEIRLADVTCDYADYSEKQNETAALRYRELLASELTPQAISLVEEQAHASPEVRDVFLTVEVSYRFSEWYRFWNDMMIPYVAWVLGDHLPWAVKVSARDSADTTRSIVCVSEFDSYLGFFVAPLYWWGRPREVAEHLAAQLGADALKLMLSGEGLPIAGCDWHTEGQDILRFDTNTEQ